MTIAKINLTQHKEVPEQGEFLAAAWKDSKILEFLNVAPGESRIDLLARADKLAHWANRNRAPMGAHNVALVGGHPALTNTLGHLLAQSGFLVVSSETARQTIEARQSDGSIKKTSVFRHTGWRVLFSFWTYQVQGIQVGDFLPDLTSALWGIEPPKVKFND